MKVENFEVVVYFYGKVIEFNLVNVVYFCNRVVVYSKFGNYVGVV